MKYAIKILFLFAVLLAVPIVVAGDLSFQHLREFDVKRACSDRGFYCDSNFGCNLTVFYPDGNIMIENRLMTNNISFRNVTIEQGLNTELGEHEAIMSCNNGTTAGQETFAITITADGKNFNIFPFQFVIIIFSGLLVGLGFASERVRMLKHLGSIMFLVMGVLTLYPGYAFINWTTLPGKIMGFVMIGGGFFFLIEDSFSRGKQTEYYSQEPEDDGRFHGND